MQERKSIFSRLDWPLTIVVLCLILFGILAIASATSEGYTEDESAVAYFASLFKGYTSSQLMFFIIGLIFVGLILILDYNNLKDFTDVIYWIAVTVLAAVLVFGSKQRGMTGWFKVGSIGIQPAEICKPVIIVCLAREFARRTEGKAGGISSFWQLLPMLWRLVIPFVLICMQPDLGTAFVYVVIFFGMLIMSRTSFKAMLPLFLVFLLAVPLAWMLMSGSQKDRIFVFLDPTKDPEGAGFNVLRAKTVSSAGGLFGKGLFSTELLTQQVNYLPEEHTDFIFSSTAEAVGFMGCAIIILVYYFIMARMMKMSSEAKDDFGACIIFGVLSMFLFHVVENIGMNMGVMPVTGIPLPFMSSGGSNLLTSMLSVGLVLNVHMRRPRRITDL